MDVYDIMLMVHYLWTIVHYYHLACPPQVPHQNASWLCQDSAVRLVGRGHVM